MLKNVVPLLLMLLCIMGAAQAATVQLPQTGQANCYDVNGNGVNCAGSGQDGNIRAGVALPSPRFTGNGDGTITDNLTGLVWLANADCFGAREWATAIGSANALANGACGLTDGSLAGQWRLPNKNELTSLLSRQPQVAIV
ncbi:MAG TPA: DUF1566 domain-containing protein, partial [Geobacteraceae bacterium]